MVSQSLQDRIGILAGDLQGVAEDMHAYEKIFGDQEMIPILNKTAPRLFLRIQYALRDSVFLGMARIADPAASRVNGEIRKNISIAGIRDDLKSEGYDDRRVSAALANLKKTAERILYYRSKCIAHLDDEVIRNGNSLVPKGGFPLDKYITQSQIFLDEVMKAIGSSERYTIKRDSYQKHAEAFQICLMYIDNNWEQLEDKLKGSNIVCAFREFSSQISSKREND